MSEHQNWDLVMPFVVTESHGYSVETLESDEEWTSVRIRLTEVRA